MENIIMELYQYIQDGPIMSNIKDRPKTFLNVGGLLPGIENTLDLIIFIEELSELGIELSRIGHGDGEEDALAEELGDCLLCLRLLQHNYGFTLDGFQALMEEAGSLPEDYGEGLGGVIKVMTKTLRGKAALDDTCTAFGTALALCGKIQEKYGLKTGRIKEFMDAKIVRMQRRIQDGCPN